MTDDDKIHLLAERVMGWLVVDSDGKDDWFERQVTRLPAYIISPWGGRWLFRAKPGVSEAVALSCPEAMCDDTGWNPLRNHADAWMIVEKMHTNGLDVTVEATESSGSLWHCYVAGKLCAAPTAALAICDAALSFLEKTQ